MNSLTSSFQRALQACKPFKVFTLLLAAAAATSVANADLLGAGNGQLVDDTVINATWAADANLFKSLADQSGNSTTFVNTIISNVGGAVGGHTLSATDFSPTDGTMDWYGAVAWVSYLNAIKYQGLATWRLPTTVNASSSSTDNPDPSSSELAELLMGELGAPQGSDVNPQSVLTVHNANFSLFKNFQAYLYWSGTNDSNPNGAWSFDARVGEDSQSANAKTSFFNVLPLVSGQVAVSSATPEPGSIWLFAAGIATLSGFAVRRGLGR